MNKESNKRKFIPIIFFILIGSFFCGCATIPSEAPELSAELGEKISALEEGNINLLNRFFDLKITEVDNFIQNEWAPDFIENIFADPKMKENWNIIVDENNSSERSKFLMITGSKIQEKINSTRLELIQPLDDIRRLLEQNIRHEYNYARSINNSITSFLLSASKVDENRSRYLKLIGITDESINKVINAVDGTVNDLVMKGRNIEDKISKGEEYIKELKFLKELLTKSEEHKNAD